MLAFTAPKALADTLLWSHLPLGKCSAATGQWHHGKIWGQRKLTPGQTPVRVKVQPNSGLQGSPEAVPTGMLCGKDTAAGDAGELVRASPLLQVPVPRAQHSFDVCEPQVCGIRNGSASWKLLPCG